MIPLHWALLMVLRVASGLWCDWAWGWFRCGWHQDQGREERWRVCAQRPEDVDHQRGRGQLVLCPSTHQVSFGRMDLLTCSSQSQTSGSGSFVSQFIHVSIMWTLPTPTMFSVSCIHIPVWNTVFFYPSNKSSSSISCCVFLAASSLPFWLNNFFPKCPFHLYSCTVL